MADYRKNPSPTKGSGGLPAVTPLEVDRVRRSVLDVVRKNIPQVREVLDGNRNWNNQQVRLFGMMLNKVMPDLHHSFNEHSIETKSENELTYEELQQIAAQALRTDIEDAEEINDDNDTAAGSEETSPNSESS